jgi:hypothetical protein
LTRAALASVLLAKTEPASPNPRGGPFGVVMGGGVRRRMFDKISVLILESVTCVTSHQSM